MMITPVEGEFVARELDGYHYVDARGRKVELPGRSGMALRVRRLGVNGAPVRTELPSD